MKLGKHWETLHQGLRFHCDVCDDKGIVIENIKHHIDAHHKPTAKKMDAKYQDALPMPD